MIHFVGLDLAFANNGIVILDDKARIVHESVFKTNSKMKPEARLIKTKEYISDLLDINKVGSIYLEGLSYGSSGQAVSQLGAMHFYIRIFLFENNLNYNIIQPGTLKKFVTGKGNAKKELILLNVYKKWGIEFTDNNLADAYCLARMALEDSNPIY